MQVSSHAAKAAHQAAPPAAAKTPAAKAGSFGDLLKSAQATVTAPAPTPASEPQAAARP